MMPTENELYRRMEAEKAYAQSNCARTEPMVGLGKSPDWPQVAGYEMTTTAVPITERLALHNVDDAMRYQPWNPDQVRDGDVVREALTAAAKAILRHVPDSPFRTKALDHIIDARMDANAAISFRGRF